MHKFAFLYSQEVVWQRSLDTFYTECQLAASVAGMHQHCLATTELGQLPAAARAIRFESGKWLRLYFCICELAGCIRYRLMLTMPQRWHVLQPTTGNTLLHSAHDKGGSGRVVQCGDIRSERKAALPAGRSEIMFALFCHRRS